MQNLSPLAACGPGVAFVDSVYSVVRAWFQGWCHRWFGCGCCWFGRGVWVWHAVSIGLQSNNDVHHVVTKHHTEIYVCRRVFRCAYSACERSSALGLDAMSTTASQRGSSRAPVVARGRSAHISYFLSDDVRAELDEINDSMEHNLVLLTIVKQTARQYRSDQALGAHEGLTVSQVILRRQLKHREAGVKKKVLKRVGSYTGNLLRR